MSKPEAKELSADRAALRRLENVVGDILTRLTDAEGRAHTLETQNAELGEVVRRFTKDQGEAVFVLSRLRELETENKDLKVRLEKGREGVERLIARLRFLEGQR